MKGYKKRLEYIRNIHFTMNDESIIKICQDVYYGNRALDKTYPQVYVIQKEWMKPLNHLQQYSPIEQYIPHNCTRLRNLGFLKVLLPSILHSFVGRSQIQYFLAPFKERKFTAHFFHRVITTRNRISLLWKTIWEIEISLKTTFFLYEQLLWEKFSL